MKRQEFLKKQIEDNDNIKRQKERELKQKLRQDAQKMKEKEDAKENKKKEYYDQLKKEYEDTRLPEINKKKNIAMELKKAKIEDKKRRKEMANKKIEEDAKKLSEKFNQLTELNKQQELQAKKAERMEKLREDRIRAQHAVPVAPITKTDHYKRDPNDRKSKSPELEKTTNSPGRSGKSPSKVPLIKALVNKQGPQELAAAINQRNSPKSTITSPAERMAQGQKQRAAL